MSDALVSESQTSGRRMAANACECCRQRKSKCDEGRPSCGRCERLKLPCVYTENNARKYTALPAIQTTLTRIEAKIDGLYKKGMLDNRLLDDVVHTASTTFPNDGRSPSALPAAHFGNSTSQFGEVSTSPSLPSHRADGLYPEHAQTCSSIEIQELGLAIPFRHSTPPQNILSWPYFKNISLHQDVGYPLKVELARPKQLTAAISLQNIFTAPGEAGWLDRLTLHEIRLLTRYYFENSHPHTPVLTKANFQEHILNVVLSDGFGLNVNTSIVLLVFALGALSAIDIGDRIWQHRMDGDGDDPGETFDIAQEFFILGNAILQAEASITWKSCQAFLLVGVFWSHKMRIYEHWNAVHQACMTIMILLQVEPRVSPLQSQIYWVAYLQESQILAELEFPPTGISRFENLIPLPFQDGTEIIDSVDDYNFVLLAQIALRRLLNRIHSYIYNSKDDADAPNTFDLLDKSSPGSMAAPIASIIQELDHQLESWRTHLPPSLLFPNIDELPLEYEHMLTPFKRSVREKLLGFLKARYCAAKAIIFRAFVYKILHVDDANSITEEDKRGAEISLRAAIQGPLHAGVLWDSFATTQVPINPCRSFFAAAILIKLMAMHEYEDIALILPKEVHIITYVQRRMEAEVAPLSPIVAKDMEILRHLDHVQSS